MNAPEFLPLTTRKVAAFLSFSVMIFLLLHAVIYPPEPLPQNYVNGIYRNAECGIIIFRNGTALFGATRVNYSLERSKNGVSAVAPHLIGIESEKSGCHVVYDEHSYSMYLPFGEDNPPHSVQLFDVNKSLVYEFTRDPR